MEFQQIITEANFVQTLEYNKFKPFIFNMYQRIKPKKITIGISAIPGKPKYSYTADRLNFEHDDFKVFLAFILSDMKLKPLPSCKFN